MPRDLRCSMTTRSTARAPVRLEKAVEGGGVAPSVRGRLFQVDDVAAVETREVLLKKAAHDARCPQGRRAAPGRIQPIGVVRGCGATPYGALASQKGGAPGTWARAGQPPSYSRTRPSALVVQVGSEPPQRPHRRRAAGAAVSTRSRTSRNGAASTIALFRFAAAPRRRAARHRRSPEVRRFDGRSL